MSMGVNAIILAAGKSSRMGRTKQLLKLKNKAVLEHVIDTILTTNFKSVTAVLGKDAQIIQSQIDIKDSRFSWIVNDRYEEGLSTSVKKGVQSINEEKLNVMLFLGDMPFIKEKTIKYILTMGIEQMNTSTTPFLIRPTYQGIPGHPVFLGNVLNSFFNSLKGDAGVKTILKNLPSKSLVELDDVGIHFDLDTLEDYALARKLILEKRMNKFPLR